MSNKLRSITTSQKWTKEESKLLLSLANSNLHKKWKKISSIIGNKSAYQCSYKYKKIVKYKKHLKLDSEDILMKNSKVSEIIKKLDKKKIKPIRKFINYKDINSTLPLTIKSDKRLNKSKEITSISFYYNSSINKPYEQSNFLNNDITTDNSKNTELFKIIKPYCHNELDFSLLWERGIELSDSLKKDSSPEETIESFTNTNDCIFVENKENIVKTSNLPSRSINFAEMLRQGSKDEFSHLKTNFTKRDSGEFNRQFEKNFHMNRNNFDDHFLKGTDLVLNNLKNEEQILIENRIRCIDSISRTLIFLNEIENKSKSLNQDEYKVFYLSTLKLLSEINNFTSLSNIFRDVVHYGLELQARLIYLLISYTEKHILGI